MIYLQLFVSFLKIGFFGFGGGYAMLALIQNEVVVIHEWMTNEQFADIVAISQVTPGPIAINTATYVGYTLTGSIWGSLLATITVCLPPLTIMLFAARYYVKLRGNRYVSGALNMMQPMMVGMILAAALILVDRVTFIDYKSWLIFGVCFVASVRKADPILIIILSAVAGLLIYA